MKRIVLFGATIALAASGCASTQTTQTPKQTTQASTAQASNKALCTKTQSDVIKLDTDLNQYLAGEVTQAPVGTSGNLSQDLSQMSADANSPAHVTVEKDVTAAIGDVGQLKGKASTSSDTTRLANVNFGLADTAMEDAGSGDWKGARAATDSLTKAIGGIASQNLAVCAH